MTANAARGVVVGLALTALICGGCAQTETEAPPEEPKPNPYLGENPPGDSPVLFAP